MHVHVQEEAGEAMADPNCPDNEDRLRSMYPIHLNPWSFSTNTLTLKALRLYKIWDAGLETNDGETSQAIVRERAGDMPASSAGPDDAAGGVAIPKPKPAPKQTKPKTLAQQAKSDTRQIYMYV